MKLKIFLSRLFRGYAEIDRVNALEKVYDAMPEGGEIVLLSQEEFNAFKAANNYPYSARSVFERNQANYLFEVTTKTNIKV